MAGGRLPALRSLLWKVSNSSEEVNNAYLHSGTKQYPPPPVDTLRVEKEEKGKIKGGKM
jgi:hypothetical protein